MWSDGTVQFESMLVHLLVRSSIRLIHA